MFPPFLDFVGYIWFAPGDEIMFFRIWGISGNVSCYKFALQGMLLPLLASHQTFGHLPMDMWRSTLFHKSLSSLRLTGILAVFERICKDNWTLPTHLDLQITV